MMKTSIVFDPLSVAQSNATSYPEPYRADNQKRWNRRLGDHAGLENFGVNLTRIAPGGQSSARHWHSKQDEFVYVLSGTVTLETNAGEQLMKPGSCAGFPKGAPDGHRFVNRSAEDVLLLVVGDRTAEDEMPIRTSTCRPGSGPTAATSSGARTGWLLKKAVGSSSRGEHSSRPTA
jgi:uncharacterized cupin superfamily protein